MTVSVRVLSSLSCLALALGVACAQDPKLDVQEASASDSANATATEPAVDVQPAHSASEAAQELPQGHPPIDLPPGHPPAGGAMAGDAMGGAIALPEVDPSAGQGEAGLVWKTPASWVAETPSSSMRRAQYRIPGAAGDAELAVFYFGPNQGGTPIDNAKRWASQFTQPDGRDPLSVVKTRMEEAHGVPVLVVETEGTYLSGSMTGGPTVARENWALLGAIAQGVDANWFFKLTGPKATIESARGGFDSLVASIEHGQ